jgi:RNA polymerase sigma-70 factor (ECF subfamily)
MDVSDLEQSLDAPRHEHPISREARAVVDAAFRAYASRLFRAALRITGNEDAARDAVQDGLVSALRHAEDFRGDAAVASWLYSIVVNAALYQRRRSHARRRGDERYEQQVHADMASGWPGAGAYADPEAYALARIELARALDGIDGLSDEKRALLEQVLYGETCAAIAARVGQPVASVKSKLWRARVAIRERVAGPQAAQSAIQ